MRSLGVRLALLYPAVSTGTLVCLFAAGFFLLQRHFIRGFDVINAAEFEQIKFRLGFGGQVLSPEHIEEHLSSMAELGAHVFYIEVRDPGGRVVFSSSNLDGRRLPEGGTGMAAFTATLPGAGELRINRFTIGTREVVVAAPMAMVGQILEGYAQVGLVLVCFILVMSLVTGLLLSQMALRPVRVIQETANRIRSDNLSERIPVPDVHDEIADLARLLNKMFDRLESSFNQVRRFSAEVSHELKTPLALVRLQTEKLLTTEPGLTAGQEEALLVQMEEINRLGQIIEDLLFLSRAEARAVAPAVQRENPREFLKAFAQDARVLAEHGGVRFELMIEGHGKVDFDRKLIRQVLLNLLTNALNVSPPRGLVTLESDFTLDSWRVALEDEGPGVPPEQRQRIFDRFVRLVPDNIGPAKGSGLGLTISRSIVQLHGDAIRAEAGARKAGLRIIFELPMARPKADAPSPSKTRTVAHSQMD